MLNEGRTGNTQLVYGSYKKESNPKDKNRFWEDKQLYATTSRSLSHYFRRSLQAHPPMRSWRAHVVEINVCLQTSALWRNRTIHCNRGSVGQEQLLKIGRKMWKAQKGKGRNLTAVSSIPLHFTIWSTFYITQQLIRNNTHLWFPLRQWKITNVHVQ